jgi:para-nitrobenzyl esterase
LFLNIHAPATGNYSNLPVMVFFHHGSFLTGWGHYWAQNPIDLVREDVIVVTFNYRLGALAFLAHPVLDDVQSKRTGNYHILDQIAVLKWVKNNIAAFGGDPKNVTLFGHSAGAVSILAHLVSPLSDGLFHKAILESGSAYHEPTPLREAEALGAQFGRAVGCSTAACFRGLPLKTILQHQRLIHRGDPEQIRIDGVVLKDAFHTLLSSGQFKKIPIISGSNQNEQQHIIEQTNIGTGGRCAFVSNLVPNGQANFPGAVTYHDAVAKYYGAAPALAAQVERQYPGGTSALSANLAFAQGQSDFLRTCRALRMHEWISQNGGQIYAYEFNDAAAPIWLFAPPRLHNRALLPIGAHHGAEMQYIFRMPPRVGCDRKYPGLNREQKNLAAAMVDYWTTFAKTGNPNPRRGTQPQWPQLTPANQQMLSLDTPKPQAMAAADFDKMHKCSSFWDQIQE